MPVRALLPDQSTGVVLIPRLEAKTKMPVRAFDFGFRIADFGKLAPLSRSGALRIATAR
jgi:hypothetical protein